MADTAKESKQNGTKSPDTDDEFMSDIECDLCSKSFNNVSMYEQHLNSKKHHQMMTKEKVKASLGSNLPPSSEKVIAGSSDEDEDTEQLHCELCDKRISGYIPYIAHIHGSVHRKNMRKQKMKESLKNQPGVLDNNDSEEDENAQKPFAKCCNKVFYDPKGYKLHLKGSSHQKEVNKQKILKDLSNDDLKIEDGDVFRCEVCDKSFSGPMPYKIHLSSPVHMKEVRRAKAEADLKDRFEKDPSTGKLVCKECNRLFPDPYAFKTHLDNNSHEKMKKKDQLFDFVASNPEIAAVKSVHSLAGESEEDDHPDEKQEYKNGQYFLVCKLCHVSFSGPQSARDHVASRKHLKEKQNATEMKKLKDKLKAGESKPNPEPAADKLKAGESKPKPEPAADKLKAGESKPKTEPAADKLKAGETKPKHEPDADNDFEML